MTVLIAANLPIISSLLMYLVSVETVKVRWGEQNNAVTFEQSILSEIHESKTFSTAFAFDSYLPLYLCVNGVAVSEVTDSHTDKLSTVTLAAHARRGSANAYQFHQNVRVPEACKGIATGVRVDWLSKGLF